MTTRDLCRATVATRCTTMMVLALVAAPLAHGQCDMQQIVAPDGDDQHNFAHTLAYSDGIVAIAGQRDERNNSTMYLYERNQNTGLFNPEPIRVISPPVDLYPALSFFGRSIELNGGVLALAGALDESDDGFGLPFIELYVRDADTGFAGVPPTRWDPGEYSPSSNVACETVVCKMQRVELARSDRSGRAGRAARGGGLSHRIVLAGDTAGEGDTPGGTRAIVLNTNGYNVQPRGIVEADSQPRASVWSAGGSAETAAVLFHVPNDSALSPRFTVYDFDGDAVVPAHVRETWLPTGTLADVSGDGIGDVIVSAAIIADQIDGQGTTSSSIELRVLRRDGDQWLVESASEAQSNPLYTESSTTASNPIFEGRSSGGVQVSVVARAVHAGGARCDLDVLMWDIEPGQPTRRKVKFKAGADLSGQVCVAGASTIDSGHALLIAQRCDDGSCAGTVRMVDPFGQDCNGNGICDDLDIADGFSSDVDENGIPDECERPVINLPFGGLVTNPLGAADVAYNEARERIEISDLSSDQDGLHTWLGQARGYAAQLDMIFACEGDSDGRGIQLNMEPADGVNALPISLALPKVNDEVLVLFDTQNMGPDSSLVVHALSASGYVTHSHTFVPPYPDVIASFMPNHDGTCPRAVEFDMISTSGRVPSPVGARNDQPYMTIGIVAKRDAAMQIDGAHVAAARALRIMINPDPSDGPLGQLAIESPLARESTWVESAVTGERGSSSLRAHLHRQTVVHRDIAIRALGESIISGESGSIRVDPVGTSGDDGFEVRPLPVLSEPTRSAFGFAVDLQRDTALHPSEVAMKVAAERNTTGEVEGYEYRMVDTLLHRVLLPGEQMHVSVELLIGGSLVRAYEGPVDSELADVISMVGLPDLLEISVVDHQTAGGVISWPTPVGVWLPGRTDLDMGDMLRFHWRPLAGGEGRSSSGQVGLSQASVTASGLAGLLLHDISDAATLSLCAGDVNADGQVNVADLLEVIAHWGSDGMLGGDVNGDGVVNVQDLLLVIAHWGCTS